MRAYPFLSFLSFMSFLSFRERVGALVWAATISRSELSYAANGLKKFRDNAELLHYEQKAAPKVLQYLSSCTVPDL